MTRITSAYERGWLAAYRKQQNSNPFNPGTDDHADYERGYGDESQRTLVLEEKAGGE